MRRFGVLDRRLQSRFARGERELPLLKAIKGAILAEEPPESGECRIIRSCASTSARNASKCIIIFYPCSGFCSHGANCSIYTPQRKVEATPSFPEPIRC